MRRKKRAASVSPRHLFQRRRGFQTTRNAVGRSGGTRPPSTIITKIPTQQSITGRVHKLLLPGKVFFLFILMAISVMLTFRHAGVKRHYPDRVSRIELCVIVGAAAMIFFPLMSQGYVQSADALFGVQQKGGFRSIVTLMSFLFGAWAHVAVAVLVPAARPGLGAGRKARRCRRKYHRGVQIRHPGVDHRALHRIGGGRASRCCCLAGLALVAVIVLLSPLARRSLRMGSDNANAA